MVGIGSRVLQIKLLVLTNSVRDQISIFTMIMKARLMNMTASMAADMTAKGNGLVMFPPLIEECDVYLHVDKLYMIKFAINTIKLSNMDKTRQSN